MAEEKKVAVNPVKLSDKDKLALYEKVETSLGKEKLVDYKDKDVDIKALPGAKHLTPGETYTVGSGTAVVLIEKGYAELAK
ncbi:MAG: hypothetical protein SFU21_13070 [Flavihumibacter sp.]|nr:hypothetical protein [Flavihumibacter sp.]